MDEMGSTPRVLVVEDEFLISAMVADVLAEHGCEVHVAANAKDALEHLTCGAPCDVLFTDINLPGGVDGATLAQLARQLRPGLPVVYASGLVSGDRAAQCGARRDLRAQAIRSGQGLRAVAKHRAGTASNLTGLAVSLH